MLFSGTLRLNLDPFEQHTDADIWKALEVSHLSNFVSGLSEGLQHVVAEGGENLRWHIFWIWTCSFIGLEFYGIYLTNSFHFFSACVITSRHVKTWCEQKVLYVAQATRWLMLLRVKVIRALSNYTRTHKWICFIHCFFLLLLGTVGLRANSSIHTNQNLGFTPSKFKVFPRLIFCQDSM